MSLPHEEAARSLYASPKNFEPVYAYPGRSLLQKGNKILVGWTFETSLPDSIATYHAWITIDHHITSDPARSASVAAKRLLAYSDYLKTLPDGERPRTVTVADPPGTPLLEAVPGKRHSDKGKEAK
ncbi:hypothetical protein [Staphylococcus pasteuri]|uniref:hypothetical protein n=1 Tax=Staphylococcus pasteuri TaxID=45972 RepID=UPI0036FCA8ED